MYIIYKWDCLETFLQFVVLPAAIVPLLTSTLTLVSLEESQEEELTTIFRIQKKLLLLQSSHFPPQYITAIMSPL